MEGGRQGMQKREGGVKAGKECVREKGGEKGRESKRGGEAGNRCTREGRGEGQGVQRKKRRQTGSAFETRETGVGLRVRSGLETRETGVGLGLRIEGLPACVPVQGWLAGWLVGWLVQVGGCGCGCGCRRARLINIVGLFYRLLGLGAAEPGHGAPFYRLLSQGPSSPAMGPLLQAVEPRDVQPSCRVEGPRASRQRPCAGRLGAGIVEAVRPVRQQIWSF
eukprot:361839-Chlamydomonas_euryale.AAC.5